MRIAKYLTLIWLVSCSSLRAEEAAQIAARIAPYLDAETFALTRIDLAKLNPNAIFDRVAKLGTVPAAELLLARLAANTGRETLVQAGVREVFSVLTTSDLPTPIRLVLTVRPDANPKAIEDVFRSSGLGQTLKAEKVGEVVIVGTSATLTRAKAVKPVAVPALQSAFAALDGHAQQAILFLTPDQRRVIAELMPKLPAEFGGGSTEFITQGLQWLAMGLSIDDKVRAKIILQASDADATAKLQKLVTKLMPLLGNIPLPKLEKSLKQVDTKRWEALLTKLMPVTRENRVVLDLADGDGLLLEVVALFAQAAVQRTEQQLTVGNAKQILLAMHSYHDATNRWPQDITDKNGKKLLSWRVALLPYLEAGELYKQFKLDEPWDSPHNRPLAAKMPDVYKAIRQQTKPGLTTYQVPVGPKTLYPPNPPQPINISSIKDGTSNTIALVQLRDEKAVLWTQPSDWVVPDDNPIADLLGRHPRSFLVAFADGSVRILPVTLDRKTFAAILTIDGGEVVDLP